MDLLNEIVAANKPESYHSTSSSGKNMSSQRNITSKIDVLSGVFVTREPSVTVLGASDSSSKVRISETHTEISKSHYSKPSTRTDNKSYEKQSAADSFFDVDSTFTTQERLRDDLPSNRSNSSKVWRPENKLIIFHWLLTKFHSCYR